MARESVRSGAASAGGSYVPTTRTPSGSAAIVRPTWPPPSIASIRRTAPRARADEIHSVEGVRHLAEGPAGRADGERAGTGRDAGRAQLEVVEPRLLAGRGEEGEARRVAPRLGERGEKARPRPGAPSRAARCLTSSTTSRPAATVSVTGGWNQISTLRCRRPVVGRMRRAIGRRASPTFVRTTRTRKRDPKTPRRESRRSRTGAPPDDEEEREDEDDDDVEEDEEEDPVRRGGGRQRPGP